MGVFKCKGIELWKPVLTKASKRQHPQNDPVLQTSQFIYFNDVSKYSLTIKECLNIGLEIILQNCSELLRQLRICMPCTNGSDDELLVATKDILTRKPFTIAECVRNKPNELNGKYDVILVENQDTLENCQLVDFLHEGGFIIYKGPEIKIFERLALNIIFNCDTKSEHFYLLRMDYNIIDKDNVVVNVKNTNFSWISELQKCIVNRNVKVVYLVSQKEDISGLVGLTNCLIKEPVDCKFKLVITDEHCEPFSLHHAFYKQQLKKNLYINIARNQKWGTYVYVDLKELAKKPVTNASVDIVTIGNLSTLAWMESLPVYKK